MRPPEYIPTAPLLRARLAGAPRCLGAETVKGDSDLDEDGDELAGPIRNQHEAWVDFHVDGDLLMDLLLTSSDSSSPSELGMRTVWQPWS